MQKLSLMLTNVSKNVKFMKNKGEKMFKKIYSKLGIIANCMALLMVIQSANTACGWIVHEPKFPETANKYKKVK